MMMRQFVIGDVHGCNVSLLALLKKIDLKMDDELYFLGDYVDRGPDSKGVFDTIFSLQRTGHKILCLFGNHEAMLIGALSGNPQDRHDWKKNGGKQTLRSFNAELPEDIPTVYTDFMEQMPLVLEVGDYILVHAGLNFNQTNPLKTTQQMIWIRDWYTKINYEWLGKRIILHGHTPQSVEISVEQVENLERDRVLCLDGGCVFNGNHLNSLMCFELNSKALFFQKNIEFQ
jgi:serine/threonine protein phosphatase 1